MDKLIVNFSLSKVVNSNYTNSNSGVTVGTYQGGSGSAVSFSDYFPKYRMKSITMFSAQAVSSTSSLRVPCFNAYAAFIPSDNIRQLITTGPVYLALGVPYYFDPSKALNSELEFDEIGANAHLQNAALGITTLHFYFRVELEENPTYARGGDRFGLGR